MESRVSYVPRSPHGSIYTHTCLPDVAQQNLCLAVAPIFLCQHSNIERQVPVRRCGVATFFEPYHAYLATIARCAKNRATAPQLTLNSRAGVVC